MLAGTGPLTCVHAMVQAPGGVGRPSSAMAKMIRGPVIIGENTVVHDCYIGPYTSVYSDCEIRNSEIEHSIILEQSQVLDLRGRMEGSLIGKNVRIVRLDQKPKAYRFMVGDNSWIGIV